MKKTTKTPTVHLTVKEGDRSSTDVRHASLIRVWDDATLEAPSLRTAGYVMLGHNARLVAPRLRRVQRLRTKPSAAIQGYAHTGLTIGSVA